MKVLVTYIDGCENSYCICDSLEDAQDFIATSKGDYHHYKVFRLEDAIHVE